MMMSNKVALVTGAAGGIGAAVVRALGDLGVLVAAVDRDEVGLGKIVDACVKRDAIVRSYPGDVTDSTDVERFVRSVESDLGPIRFLVNSAGILRPGEVRDCGDQEWSDTFAVNATGVFNVSRAVVRRMCTRCTGSIVTIASNAASTPRAGMAAYAASKAAASMFTKSLGLEVARFGIRCNLVAPGSTDTPMLASMWKDPSGRDHMLRGNPESFRLGIPLGRPANPVDIASSVVFLLSDQASHITLHELTVDGGATLGA